MAKRKRESITFGDKSFENVAQLQKKKIKKINAKSRCKQVHYYVHQPVFDSKTDEFKGIHRKEYLFKNCFDPIMGARPMSRLIQDKIKKSLADEILFGKLSNGGSVSVDVNNEGEIKLNFIEELASV